MPSECLIFFDDSDSVFYSGSNVSGRFELTTNSSKNIRGIVVRITGTANVCFDENKIPKHNGSHLTKIIEYKTRESIFNYEKYLLGSKYDDHFELEPGTYEYTFNYDLPMNIPSSFTGKYGEIIYEVCVEIDRTNLTYSNKFKRAFTVIYLLDLNSSPEYRQTKFINDNVNYNCCSCLFGRGNVDAEIIIPRSGYVAGQDIPYKLIISNNTRSDLNKKSKIELIRKVTFESQIPERRLKYREVILDHKNVGPISKLSKKEFQNILEIPTVPPITPANFNCIQIEYFIKAEILTGCCTDYLRLYLPIIIGAIPLIALEESNGVIISQPTTPNWEDHTFGPFTNLDLPPGYTGPPFYEDAKKLSEEFEKKQIGIDKQVPYTPKYPVFFNNRIPTTPYYENDI